MDSIHFYRCEKMKRKVRKQTGIPDSNPNKTEIMKIMDDGLTIGRAGKVLAEINPGTQFVYPFLKRRDKKGRLRVDLNTWTPFQYKTWRLAKEMSKKDKGKHGGPADFYLKLALGQAGFVVSRALSPMDLITDYKKGTGTDLGPIMSLVSGDFTEAGLADALKTHKKRRRRR